MAAYSKEFTVADLPASREALRARQYSLMTQVRKASPRTMLCEKVLDTVNRTMTTKRISK